MGIGADCIIDPDGGGPRIWFQVVPEPKNVKNRLHLDVHVSGGRAVPIETRRQRVDAEARRLADFGATMVGVLSEEGIDHYGVAMNQAPSRVKALDRRVGPGRGAAVASGPFPRPAPPNPACQSSRHRALPEPPPACATGADGRWIRSTRYPRRPGIHQEPPALPATPGRLAASLRPVPGSPGLRLLRRLRHARTPSADGALAHHPAGDVGRFPRSPLADRRGRCPAESRQHRHRYAAGLPDGLLLGPVLRGRSRPPARSRRACAATRPASARFGAGRQLTGRQHWFLAYTFSSCLPDPHPPVVQARPGVVRAASHPHRRLPDQAALSFTALLRQDGGGGLSPPLGSWRLVALEVVDPDHPGQQLGPFGPGPRGATLAGGPLGQVNAGGDQHP